MRVLLDTTFVRRGPTGMRVYIEQLLPALRAAGADVVEECNERRRPPAGGGLGSVRNAALDRWWTAVELPARALRAGADVIHHPLPALAPLAHRPQVITVLDLAFERLPAHFDARYRLFAHLSHRSAARRADAVICISETTAQDVRTLWGVPAERITVAPLGPGQVAVPAGRRPSARHFLYVGDAEPRKNLALLLAAHRLYREAAGARALPLVLAGRASAGQPGVLVEDRPAPARLAELYREAMALVHPALHEGFGLPLLEAMGAGTPVIAARSPGVVETCGEAALYADPRDPVAFAAAMGELAGDAALRRRLRERGRRRAGSFSWDRCAKLHLEAYTSVGRP